jgi:hypothetical protein
MFLTSHRTKRLDFSLEFQLNHLSTIADDSHGDFQSDNTGGTSHTPFEEVLHEIMERIANALADGQVPEQAPDQQEIAHGPRYCLINFTPFLSWFSVVCC